MTVTDLLIAFVELAALFVVSVGIARVSERVVLWHRRRAIRKLMAEQARAVRS